MTNQESYDSFKESCSDKVGELMSAHAQEKRAMYEKRKESADKEYRLRYTEEKLPFIFPGLSWWLQQRPPEVVPMDDHTTGLCRVIQLSLVNCSIEYDVLWMFFIQVCEAARLNFAELVKFVKKGCRCKTKLCQNWECTCIRDDDTGELGDCVCPACDCMSCTSCQVQTLFTKRLKYCFNHWYVSPQQHGIFSFYLYS